MYHALWSFILVLVNEFRSIPEIMPKIVLKTASSFNSPIISENVTRDHSLFISKVNIALSPIFSFFISRVRSCVSFYISLYTMYLNLLNVYQRRIDVGKRHMVSGIEPYNKRNHWWCLICISICIKNDEWRLIF